MSELVEECPSFIRRQHRDAAGNSVWRSSARRTTSSQLVTHRNGDPQGKTELFHLLLLVSLSRQVESIKFLRLAFFMLSHSNYGVMTDHLLCSVSARHV
jgi:hypothetical protein